jgi:S1-C subfamily serine protease
MFDENGNVIAITVKGISSGQVSMGVNFFIPITDALAKLGVQQK